MRKRRRRVERENIREGRSVKKNGGSVRMDNERQRDWRWRERRVRKEIGTDCMPWRQERRRDGR